jgi:hypothetical protein
MQDSAGNQIPTRYIQKIDRERDKLVRRLFAKAEKLSAALTAFRAECLAEVARFQEHAATAYGVPLGGEKNGLMLSSFDGTLRVERRACDTLAFDDRLNAAQQLLDEWIRENTSGVNPDLLKLVNRAFRNTRNSGLRFGEVSICSLAWSASARRDSSLPARWRTTRSRWKRRWRKSGKTLSARSYRPPFA